MVNDRILNSDTLVRRAHVPADRRTSSRDELAEWLVETFVNSDEDWAQWTMTDVAEAYGCSRQHVAHVLENYFAPPGDEGPYSELADTIVESEGNNYDEAYSAGFAAGLEFALERRGWLTQLLEANGQHVETDD